MKKILCMTMGFAALSFMLGCATEYHKGEKPKVVEGGESPQKPEKTSRKRVVSVKITASDATAARLATSLVSPVKFALQTQGFDTHASSPADTTVTIVVTRNEKGKLDDWRVYEGTADVRVEDVRATKILGVQTFTAVGERSRDEVAAEKGVADSLVTQMRAWLAKTADASEIVM